MFVFGIGIANKRDETRYDILLQPIKPWFGEFRAWCKVLALELGFHLFYILCLFRSCGRNIKDAIYPFVIVCSCKRIGTVSLELELVHAIC